MLRRTTIAGLGIAGAGVAVAVAIGVGTTIGGAATSLPAVNSELDTSSIVAQGAIGSAQFVVAPGTGKMATPGGMCFAGTDMGGQGTFLVCGDASTYASQGAVLREQDPDGTVTIYGYAPPGTRSVTVSGAAIPVTGSFYSAKIPSSAASVTVETGAGAHDVPLS